MNFKIDRKNLIGTSHKADERNFSDIIAFDNHVIALS